ncbi:MAG: sigma-70 family RNA polymerase sigma factor [Anaerolineae bacterium]
MTDRTNETWLADLQADGPPRAAALEDLRIHLVRGVYFYLSHDRSDLSSLSSTEIEQMAEDFVQEALLKVLDNLHTFRGESRFTTWAAKIAARVAISELRRARYRDYSLDHLTADGEIMPSITSLAISPQEAPLPESYTEQQSVLAVIARGLETVLTERQRIALTAYTLDGVPMEEIARRMGTNRNALYKLVHDARVKLKRFLEAEGLSLDYILNLFGEE